MSCIPLFLRLSVSGKLQFHSPTASGLLLTPEDVKPTRYNTAKYVLDLSKETFSYTGCGHPCVVYVDFCIIGVCKSSLYLYGAALMLTCKYDV